MRLILSFVFIVGIVGTSSAFSTNLILPANGIPPLRDTATVTAWASYSMTIGGSTTAPTKASSPSVDSAMWRRVGDSMEITYVYRHTNNSGAAAGSGTYLFSLPSGYSIDSNKVSVTTSNSINSLLGSAKGISSSEFLGYVWAYSSTQLAICITSTSSAFGQSVGSGPSPMDGSSVAYSFTASVPISGWST